MPCEMPRTSPSSEKSESKILLEGNEVRPFAAADEHLLGRGIVAWVVGTAAAIGVPRK